MRAAFTEAVSISLNPQNWEILMQALSLSVSVSELSNKYLSSLDCARQLALPGLSAPERSVLSNNSRFVRRAHP